MSERHWYILYTKPRFEKKVNGEILKKGLVSYLPLQSKKQQWSDRVKVVEFPLFPGYLFVRIDYARESIKVLQIPGAQYFLRDRDKPAILDDSIIEGLKEATLKKADIQSLPPDQELVGQRVTVVNGPFKGLSGVVEKVRNSRRLIISIPYMNQLTSVTIDSLDIDLKFEGDIV